MTSTSSCNVPETVTVPAEMVKSPVKVLVFDNVKVPLPALVKIADDAPSLMIPVIDEVSVLVISRVPCTLIAAADNAPVVIVVLPMAVDPPTASVNVTSPVPAAITSASPAVPALVVPPKDTLAFVVVNVMSLEMVTAPVYVCVDEVVTSAPRLEVPETSNVDNPVAAPSRSKLPVMVNPLVPPARVSTKLTIDAVNVLSAPDNVTALV